MLILSQDGCRVIELRHVWIGQEQTFQSMDWPGEEFVQRQREPRYRIIAETYAASNEAMATYESEETAKRVLSAMLRECIMGTAVYQFPDDNNGRGE